MVRGYLEQAWGKTACGWLSCEESSHWLDLELIGLTHFHLMPAHNMLEFEYANLLTAGCDKLDKYIYTEEVEDFFSAKKIVLEPSAEFTAALARYLGMRRQIQDLQTRLLKKVSSVLSRLKKEAGEGREWKHLLSTKTKVRQQLEQLFAVYGTLSTHFLYQRDGEAFKGMVP